MGKLVEGMVKCESLADELVGVDTYGDSPIYKTHMSKQNRKKDHYTKPGEKALKKKLDDFCANFKVDKFIEERDKCDDMMEDKFSMSCEMKAF